ncbi:MAG: hypothetical protein ACXWC8_11760, partial [Limisphaerales bacterium]
VISAGYEERERSFMKMNGTDWFLKSYEVHSDYVLRPTTTRQRFGVRAVLCRFGILKTQIILLPYSTAVCKLNSSCNNPSAQMTE